MHYAGYGFPTLPYPCYAGPLGYAGYAPGPWPLGYVGYTVSVPSAGHDGHSVPCATYTGPLSAAASALSSLIRVMPDPPGSAATQ